MPTSDSDHESIDEEEGEEEEEVEEEEEEEEEEVEEEEEEAEAEAEEGDYGDGGEEEEADEDDEVVEEEEDEEGGGEEGVEEEEEDEEEEEEIEEEKAEEEDEEEGKDEDGGGDGAIPMADDSGDTIKKLELKGHGEDLELVLSIPLGSENKKASLSHNKDGGNSDLTSHDPSADMLAAHKKEVSDNSEVSRLAVLDKHISSKEIEFPTSLLDEKEIKVLAEEQAFNVDSEGAKSSSVNTHGNHPSHLSSVDPIGDKNNVEASMTDTTIGKSDGVLEIEVPQSQVQTELQMPEGSSLSSKQIPQRRPRSSSPGDTIQTLNKKPAIICDFFARGWCIKGSSCRFLHQKDDNEDLHQKEGNKEDLTGPSKKADTMYGTGANEEAERAKLTSSREIPDTSNTQSSSKSEFQIQRDLVRAYGGVNDGSAHFNYDYKSHIREESHRVDRHQGGSTLLQEAYKTDPMDERQSASGHLLSTRYLNEGKPQMEIPRMEFLNDPSFPRGSSSAMNSLVAENIHYSGGQSPSSSLFNSNFPLAYDKRSEDLAFHGQQRKLPFHGSYSSYSLTGSLRPNFNSSLQTASVSPSPYTFSQAGISAPGSTPFSTEGVDIHKTLEADRGYNGSRSASLPRSSSPYFSILEVESIAPRRISRDLPAFVAQKTLIQENSWEPSVPFRPSFHYPLPSLSSAGNQYDPLTDSIELPNTGNLTLQASQRAINQNVSSHSVNGDPLLYGHNVTGMQGPLSSFPQSYQGTSGKTSPQHGLSARPAKVAAPGPSTADGGKGSMPKEEKLGYPDHIAENADVNDAEVGGDPRAGKGRNMKETKTMKIFRAALVEFVKELVKPSWREGHLSKDAHKTVVKKAVEKVLNALQTHQIPSTTESIDQYLSNSRPKILKLVEGYVDKYSKSGAPSLPD